MQTARDLFGNIDQRNVDHLAGEVSVAVLAAKRRKAVKTLEVADLQRVDNHERALAPLRLDQLPARQLLNRLADRCAADRVLLRKLHLRGNNVARFVYAYCNIICNHMVNFHIC